MFRCFVSYDETSGVVLPMVKTFSVYIYGFSQLVGLFYRPGIHAGT